MESGPLPPPPLYPLPFPLPGGVKRKTPSELRAEQLKRARSTQDESGQGLAGSGALKAVEGGKATRLVDTRVPDVFAASKPGDRPLKFLPLRDKSKNNNGVSQLRREEKAASPPDNSWKIVAKPGSISEPNSGSLYSQSALAPCSSFKNVTQLSSVVRNSLNNGAGASLVGAFFDKGFQNSLNHGRGLPSAGQVQHQVVEKPISPQSISATKLTSVNVPLDLSLKKSARLLSPSPFHWCHQMSTKSQCCGVRQFADLANCNSEITGSRPPEFRPDSAAVSEQASASFWQALHSWVHPQSSLPPGMASSAVRGGEAERAFHNQRSQMWESAFQSLYYMFRNKHCSIFYVCSQQFVVMFVGGMIGGRHEDACSAFLTRSTKGLRGLLLKQDVRFTMPFCKSDTGAATEQELLDLNEFEKIRPGQTRFVDSAAAVDNSMSSVLAFDGCNNVHRLYDFLLNQRSLLPSSGTWDVPTLLSPVPFEHATLAKPELSCKQMQRDEAAAKTMIHGASDSCTEAGSGMAYSVDIKGMPLAPWVITRICNVLRMTQPAGFDLSFSTDSFTDGLNIAQGTPKDLKPRNNSSKDYCIFSQEVAYSSALGSASLRQLKFRHDAYSFLPVPQS